MKTKITRVIIETVGIVIVIVCGLLIAQSFLVQREIVRSSRNVGDVVKGTSETAMRDQTVTFLEDTATMRARLYDDMFKSFQTAVATIADAAEDLYVHPERYGKDKPEHYDASDMGELVTYVAYGDNVDPKKDSVEDETALLSNLHSVLRSVNASNEEVATDYYASESGLFVCSEPVSEYNLPVNSTPLYFEARQRPWYQDAKEAGQMVFTGMMLDADTKEYAISCAVPVYAGGKCKGVAGAGMFLSTIREDVDSFRIGGNGFACVVNGYGQILFSGAESGELVSSKDQDQDLRESDNAELADLTKHAINGESGVSLLEIDGNRYYVAYAPMETVSWSYFTVLPEKEVTAPTEELLSELDENNALQIAAIKKSIISSVILMVVILILVCVLMNYIAARFADRLSQPVKQLTEKVSALEGDNLDFSWDIDTGDEIQILANAFGSMTDRMKKYIDDITQITAEKEHIGVELALAAHIQASMLPKNFPVHSSTSEFDIYAVMDPAKEVGGDFYDFFHLDRDHLAIVIADVAGKGVPASLFMVIAMTMIENTTHAIGMVDQVFNITNNQLCEGNSEDMFVTAWIGIVDLKTGAMSWCDAGHENPYIIHPDGSMDLLKPSRKKLPMAAMENTSYLANMTFLEPGDSLFLYTDGVVEATNISNELYGGERLKAVLEGCGEDSPETMLKKVRDSVDEFVGEAAQFDDLTMLGFKYYGASGEEET